MIHSLSLSVSFCVAVVPWPSTAFMNIFSPSSDKASQFSFGELLFPTLRQLESGSVSPILWCQRWTLNFIIPCLGHTHHHSGIDMWEATLVFLLKLSGKKHCTFKIAEGPCEPGATGDHMSRACLRMKPEMNNFRPAMPNPFRLGAPLPKLDQFRSGFCHLQLKNFQFWMAACFRLGTIWQ